MAANIDDIDKKILIEIQQDASIGSEALGEKIGLSASATQRRLKNLRKMKVIKNTITVLDAEALAYPLTLVALVETARETAIERENMKRWCRNQPEVQQAYYITGTADLMLIILAESIASYDNLMKKFLEKNPSARKYTTNVTIEQFKTGLKVPIKIS